MIIEEIENFCIVTRISSTDTCWMAIHAKAVYRFVNRQIFFGDERVETMARIDFHVFMEEYVIDGMGDL